MTSLDGRENDKGNGLQLTTFGNELNIAIIGASGGIGGALADQLARIDTVAATFRLSRSQNHGDDGLTIDLEDEASVERAAREVRVRAGTLDMVLVATGILHEGDHLAPEKSWRTLTPAALQRAYAINAIGPAIVAKHFLPLLRDDRKSVYAALSARVASISDNELGGWHSYRASKAALNMLIKNFAIELARKNPYGLCVGLHPGTVDTNLSAPFQRGVPEGKLFSPQHSARSLLMVIDGLSDGDSGFLYAWDGQRIPY